MRRYKRLTNAQIGSKQSWKMAGKSGYELVQELYPDRYEGSMILLASRTIGLLDLLLDRGEIFLEEINGVIYYTA